MTAKELMHVKNTIENMVAADPHITDVIINYQVREAKHRNFENINIKINR